MTDCSYGDDETFGELPASPAAAHAQHMMALGARHAAAVALGRWSRTAPVAAAARLDWLSDAQQGLQGWLQAGGFAQQASTLPLVRDCIGAPLSFPGSRPRFYTLFRNSRSTAA